MNVVRNEPLNALPPDFVTVFTTPPVKRPNSAETVDVDVVVSAIASSMKRLFGVPRMLSVMTAPSTVKRLSKDWPPEIVTTGATPLPIRSLEPGPFVFTPAASATEDRSVRVTGRLSVSSFVNVCAACGVDVATVSDLATTVAVASTPASGRTASRRASWPTVTGSARVSVLKPWSVNVTVYAPGGRPGKT